MRIMSKQNSLSYRNRIFLCFYCFILSSTLLAQTYNEKTFFQAIGDLTGGEYYSRAFGISANGKVIVGESSTEGGKEAFYWTSSEGMVSIGDLPGGDLNSSARATSADGAIIVGSGASHNPATYSSRQEAFRWTKNDGMVGLGFLNEEQVGNPSSAAMDITPDGSVIVGKSKNVFEEVLKEDEAFRWKNGVMTGLQTYMSTAYGVSPDGEIVVGSGNTQGRNEAFIWILGSPPQVFRQPFSGSVSYAMAASDNKTFVGMASNIDGYWEAFRWVYGIGLIPMGFVPGMGQWSFATDVSSDGSIIVGNANAGSDIRAFIWDETNGMRDLKSVLEEGGADLTGWTLSSAQAVSGSGDTIAGYGINPAGNTEAWIAGIGPSEYRLKRVNLNDEIEYFDVNTHAWNFKNKNSNMWPEEWWNVFDYDSELFFHEIDDPIYINSSSRFPDWFIFTEAFEYRQCYRGLYPYQIAFDIWKVISEPRVKSNSLTPEVKYWGGSCYGFAISSFLSFNFEKKFIDKFPDLHWDGYLNSFNINDNEYGDYYRKIINELHLYQWGDQQMDWDEEKKNASPNKTLTEIKQMFADDKQDDQILLLKLDSPSSGHAVNPYKIETDKDKPSIEWIYIYDSNYPNDSTRRIKIENNSWEYTIAPDNVWSSDKGFHLGPPMSIYFDMPTLFNQKYSLKSGTSSNSDYIRVFNTQSASTTITNSLDLSIGFADSSVYNHLAKGIPIIPYVGSYHPPIGYYLPQDNYSIKLTDFSDSVTYTTFFSDSVVYNYERFDAGSEQTDLLKYENGLCIYNEDNEEKTINIGSIAVQDSLELVFEINNCLLSEFDSLDIRLGDRDVLYLNNSGKQKNYDLLIRIISESLNKTFTQNQIGLAENTTHQIIPEWNNIDIESIMILIDSGNVGEFIDTIFLINEVTSIAKENLDSQKKLSGYDLVQNFPNPFNLSTTIGFGIPKDCFVTLQVFNINGQLMETLVNEHKDVGRHNLLWDAARYNSGLYYYKITAGDFSAVKKCILID